MWSQFLESFATAVAPTIDSVKTAPAWPILKNPIFIVVFGAILFVLLLRRAYQAVVLLSSSLVAVVICQATLIDVDAPDCFAGKLPVFVAGFIVIAAVNVYFLLIRD
jgi:hypothetical protein